MGGRSEREREEGGGRKEEQIFFFSRHCGFEKLPKVSQPILKLLVHEAKEAARELQKRRRKKKTRSQIFLSRLRFPAAFKPFHLSLCYFQVSLSLFFLFSFFPFPSREQRNPIL